jgi:hypothetical protein
LKTNSSACIRKRIRPATRFSASTTPRIRSIVSSKPSSAPKPGNPAPFTRILHYGDSPTTADLITGDARKLLQARFGDAGHGFVLLGKPWAWYDHNGVSLVDSGWTIDPATQSRLHDGLYGLGGVSFIGPVGAYTNVTLKDAGHTALEVSYLRQPGGGIFQIGAEGHILGTVDTRSRAVEPGYSAFEIPPHARHFEIRVAAGPVRALGLRFEKPGPGIEYEAWASTAHSSPSSLAFSMPRIGASSYATCSPTSL